MKDEGTKRSGFSPNTYLGGQMPVSVRGQVEGKRPDEHPETSEASENNIKSSSPRITTSKSAHKRTPISGANVSNSNRKDDSTSNKKEKDTKQKRKKVRGYESDYFSGDSFGGADSKHKIKTPSKNINNKASTSQAQQTEKHPQKASKSRVVGTSMDSEDFTSYNQERSEKQGKEKSVPSKDSRATKSEKENHKTNELTDNKNPIVHSRQSSAKKDHDISSNDNKRQRNSSTSRTGKQKTNSPIKRGRKTDDDKSPSKKPQGPDDPGPSSRYPQGPMDPSQRSETSRELKDAQCQMTRYKSGKIHFSSKRFRRPTHSVPRTRDAQCHICSILDTVVDFTFEKFPTSDRGRNFRRVETPQATQMRDNQAQTLVDLEKSDNRAYKEYEAFEEKWRREGRRLGNGTRWNTNFRGPSHVFTEETSKPRTTGDDDTSTIFTDSHSPNSTASKETTESSGTENGSRRSADTEDEKHDESYSNTQDQETSSDVQTSATKSETSKPDKNKDQQISSDAPQTQNPVYKIPPQEPEESQTSHQEMEKRESGKQTPKSSAPKTKDPGDNSGRYSTSKKDTGKDLNTTNTPEEPRNDSSTSSKQHLQSKTMPRINYDEDFKDFSSPKGANVQEDVDDSGAEQLDFKTYSDEVPSKEQKKRGKEATETKSSGTHGKASIESHQTLATEKPSISKKPKTSVEPSNKTDLEKDEAIILSETEVEPYMSSGPPSIFQVDPSDATQEMKAELTKNEPAHSAKSNLIRQSDEVSQTKSTRNQKSDKNKNPETKHGTCQSTKNEDHFNKRGPKGTDELLSVEGKSTKTTVKTTATSSKKDDPFGNETPRDTVSADSGSDHFSYKGSGGVTDDSGSVQYDYKTDTDCSSTKSEDKKSYETESKEISRSQIVQAGSQSDLAKEMFDSIVSGGVYVPPEVKLDETGEMEAYENVENEPASNMNVSENNLPNREVRSSESKKDAEDDQSKHQSENKYSIPQSDRIRSASSRQSQSEKTGLEGSSYSAIKEEPKVNKTPTNSTLDLSGEVDKNEALRAETSQIGPLAETVDTSPTKSDDSEGQSSASYEKISDSEFKEDFETIYPRKTTEKPLGQQEKQDRLIETKTKPESNNQDSGTFVEAKPDQPDTVQTSKPQDTQEISKASETQRDDEFGTTVQEETPFGQTKTTENEFSSPSEVTENVVSEDPTPETEGSMTESTTSSSQGTQNGEQSNGNSSNDSFVDVEADLSPTQSVDSNGFVKVHGNASDLKQDEIDVPSSEKNEVKFYEQSEELGDPQSNASPSENQSKNPKIPDKLDSQENETQSLQGVGHSDNVTVDSTINLSLDSTEETVKTEAEGKNEEPRETGAVSEEPRGQLSSQPESGDWENQQNKTDRNQTSGEEGEKVSFDEASDKLVCMEGDDPEKSLRPSESQDEEEPSKPETEKAVENEPSEATEKSNRKCSSTNTADDDFNHKEGQTANGDSSNGSYVDIKADLSPTRSVDSNEFVKVHENATDLRQHETEMHAPDSCQMKPSEQSDEIGTLDGGEISLKNPNMELTDVSKHWEPDEANNLNEVETKETTNEKTSSEIVTEEPTETTEKIGSETQNTESDPAPQTDEPRDEQSIELATGNQSQESKSHPEKIDHDETFIRNGDEDESINDTIEESTGTESKVSDTLPTPISSQIKYEIPGPPQPDSETEKATTETKSDNSVQHPKNVDKPRKTEELENFSSPVTIQKPINPQDETPPVVQTELTESKDKIGSVHNGSKSDTQTDNASTETPAFSDTSTESIDFQNIKEFDFDPVEASKNSAWIEQPRANYEDTSENLEPKSLCAVEQIESGSEIKETSQVFACNISNESKKTDDNTTPSALSSEAENIAIKIDHEPSQNRDVESNDEKRKQSNKSPISSTSPDAGSYYSGKMEIIKTDDQTRGEAPQLSSTTESDMESSIKSEENGPQSNASWDKMSEFDGKEQFEVSNSPPDSSLNFEDSSMAEIKSDEMEPTGLATCGCTQAEPASQSGTMDRRTEENTPSEVSTRNVAISSSRESKVELQPVDDEPNSGR